MAIFKTAGLRGNHQIAWDNRPQVIISTFNGSWDTSANGLNFNWREGASNPTGWLHTFIDNVYNSGFRRIMLYLPGGSAPSGNSNFGSDQWNTMPAYKQSYFQNQFRNWVAARPDVSVGIYQGWRIASGALTGTFAMSYTPDTIPSFTTPGHLDFIAKTMVPWIRCGVRFFGMDFAGAVTTDATGAHPAYFLPWAKFFNDKYSVELIGEAFPRFTGPTISAPFKYSYNTTPWYSTFAYHSGNLDPSGSWLINNRNQRVYIGCTQPGTSTGNMTNLVNRGFILESYNYFDSGYILGVTPGGGAGNGMPNPPANPFGNGGLGGGNQGNDQVPF